MSMTTFAPVRIAVRRTAVALGAAALLFAGSAGAQTASANWRSHVDNELDFQLRVPSHLEAQGRVDARGLFSEVLSFRAPAAGKVEAHAFVPQIQVGQYLYTIEAGESLYDWTLRYRDFDGSSELNAMVDEIEDTRVGGHEAVYVRGTSDLGAFQYFNVRRGETVWFLWSNFPGTRTQGMGRSLNRVAASFQFGDRAPQSLVEIYGFGFPVRTLDEAMTAASSATEVATRVSSSWWAPLLKNGASQWSITCGSSFHTNGARFAADVAASSGTSVKNAYAGAVVFSGWDTSGYGNLVKIGPSGGYHHYYAHLSSTSVTSGSSPGQGVEVGKVGNTGTSAVHLHHQVQSGASQSTATGITLVGMVGFTDNAADNWYPSNDGVSHYSCAWMGR